tara:strand:- start:354 stop:533 length:180 start_codon:yes stop_codon:yes gene_type:complete
MKIEAKNFWINYAFFTTHMNLLPGNLSIAQLCLSLLAHGQLNTPLAPLKSDGLYNIRTT